MSAENIPFLCPWALVATLPLPRDIEKPFQFDAAAQPFPPFVPTGGGGTARFIADAPSVNVFVSLFSARAGRRKKVWIHDMQSAIGQMPTGSILSLGESGCTFDPLSSIPLPMSMFSRNPFLDFGPPTWLLPATHLVPVPRHHQ